MLLQFTGHFLFIYARPLRLVACNAEYLLKIINCEVLMVLSKKLRLRAFA